MHLINYISPSCRIIHISVEGVMMQSTQYRLNSSNGMEVYTVEDDSDNWN